MRKIILMIMMLLVVIGSVAFAAESDDVYLRRDVFEARMDAMYNKLDGRINTLSVKIDGVNANVSSSQNLLYVIVALLGFLVVTPYYQKIKELKQTQIATLTSEDMEKIVEKILDKRFGTINNPQVFGK